MQGMLFSAAQSYAWILECSKKLLTHETSAEPANKTEHQINTRLFNNAFCGLLRLGYPYELSKEESADYLVFVIDGVQYKCPVGTAANVLREEFERYAPDAAALVPQKSKDKKAKSPETKMPPKERKEDTPTKTPEGAGENIKPAPPANPELKPDTPKPPTPILSTSNREETKAAKDTPVSTKDPSVEPAKEMQVSKVEAPVERKVSVEKPVSEKTVLPETQDKDVKKEMHRTPETKHTVKEEKPKTDASSVLMSAGFPNLDDLSFAFSKGSKKVLDIGVDAESKPESAIPKKTENSEMVNPDPVKEETPISVATDTYTEEQAEPAKQNEPKSEEAMRVAAPLPEIDDSFMLPPDEEEDEEPLLLGGIPVREPAPTKNTEGKDASFAEEKPQEHTDTTAETATVKTEPVVIAPAEESKASVTPNPVGSFFKPKSQPVIREEHEVHAVETPTAPVEEKTKEEKKGLFAFFKKEKPDKVESPAPSLDTPVPVDEVKREPVIPEVRETLSPPAEAAPAMDAKAETPAPNTAVEEYDFSQDGGTLFQHIHQVAVKPRFGDAIVSRARFIIWPTRIITMHTGTTFADILVHVTDEEGNEQIFCTEGKVQQLKMTVGGKHYCVYGIWNNSVFESHVTLDDKSASMFRMEEEVTKHEPKGRYGDEFLDQFRYDHKGQPFHFVVPFLSGNRGERNIPIVGYVAMDGKKYALERCEGNTLRYRTRTKADKIIRGHWEKGQFTFTIDDATRVLWDEDVI